MNEEPAPKRGLARNTANYGDRDFALYLRRSFAKSMGYSQAMLDKLDAMLGREGHAELAAACFRFLPHRARLDLAGWAAEDIFSHSA